MAIRESNKMGEIPFPPFALARVLSEEEVRMIALNVDPFALPHVQAAQIRTLPEAAGVYFLLLHKEVVYIGRAINLAQRWRRHRHFKSLQQPGARLAYLVLRDGPYLSYFRQQLEVDFINRLRPALNKHMRRSG